MFSDFSHADNDNLQLLTAAPPPQSVFPFLSSTSRQPFFLSVSSCYDLLAHPNPFIYLSDLLARRLTSPTSPLVCTFLLFPDIFSTPTLRARRQNLAESHSCRHDPAAAAGMRAGRKSFPRRLLWDLTLTTVVCGAERVLCQRVAGCDTSRCGDAQPRRAFSKIFTLHELIKCLLHIRRDLGKKNTVLNVMS